MKPQSTTREHHLHAVVVAALVVVDRPGADVCAGARRPPRRRGQRRQRRSGRRTARRGRQGRRRLRRGRRRGAVVSGEEGYAAVGRNGNVVTGEDVDVDGGGVGRRGAVVVGEEGAAAVGRYGGVVVADRYESYDAWKAVAAVGAGIAIGTMLAKPPAAATTVVVTGSTYYYHDNVYYTRVMSSGDGRLPGRRASRGRDHHDAPGRLHERDTSAARRTRSAARRTTHGVDGLSGGRAEVTPEVGRADRRSPAMARAAARRAAAGGGGRAGDLARTAGLSPWKGGGFGMFSTTDDAGRRRVRVFVSAPERSEEIAHLAVARGRRRACGGAAERRPALAPGAPGRRTRAPVSTARSTPSASRRGASSTRPTRWRRRSVSCATSSTVWTRLLRPAGDEDGVADSVLTLTAIILLLRPLDVWWVAPFVLAAACLSLVVRGVRRAPITWLLVAVLVAARIVFVWPLSDNHIYLLAYWCLAIGLALVGPDARGDAGGEQPMAPRRRVRDGGAVEGGAVAGLRRWPLLQGDAADRRAVCRCVAGVRRAVARSDGARTASSSSRCRKAPSSSIRRRSSSRRVCACSRRSPRGAGWCSKR